MKAFKTISIRDLPKSVLPTAPLMRNNNKWFRWSKDMKSNHNWNAILTRTSRAWERRRSLSELSQVHTDTGTLSQPTKEMEWLILVSPETILDFCSHSCQCSSSSILPSQSFMEIFTSSITITSSGTLSISSSVWIDHFTLIKQSPDWLDQ